MQKPFVLNNHRQVVCSRHSDSGDSTKKSVSKGKKNKKKTARRSGQGAGSRKHAAGFPSLSPSFFLSISCHSPLLSEPLEQVINRKLHKRRKSHTTGYQDRGGSRGRVQGVRTPLPPDLRFSNTTGILQKKKIKLCGLLVLK